MTSGPLAPTLKVLEIMKRNTKYPFLFRKLSENILTQFIKPMYSGLLLLFFRWETRISQGAGKNSGLGSIASKP